MKYRQLVQLVVLAASLPLVAAPPINHRFLAMDEGARQLLFVDQLNPTADWTVPCEGRDLQLIGDNRILTNWEVDPRGYAEYDLATGKRVKKVDLNFGLIRSLRRLANGDTVVAGDNLAGHKGITLLQIDTGGNVVRETAIPDTKDLRLMRRGPDGTSFFIGTGDRVLEVNWSGAILWQCRLPITARYGGYMSLRQPNGNVLTTTGYHPAVLEIAPDGTVVRSIGGPTQPDTDRIHPYFTGGFQVLPNGNIVTSNWQGHGPGHGRSGLQLLEYNAAGERVWSWSDPRPEPRFSSLHNVLVLDGLDLSLLHDDRTGTLKPDPQ